MDFSSIPFVARATPPAGSAPEWVAAGSFYNQPSAQTSHVIDVPAGAQVGDMLLINAWQGLTGASMATDTSQSLVELATYASPMEIGPLWGVVISGSVPSTITVTLSSADGLQAQCLIARGVTAVGGVIDDGNSGSAITTYPYTATVGNSLVFASISHNGAIDVASATFNGADPADLIGNFPLQYLSNICGVHNGATGANTFGLTWTGTSTGGRWLTVELVP